MIVCQNTLDTKTQCGKPARNHLMYKSLNGDTYEKILCDFCFCNNNPETNKDECVGWYAANIGLEYSEEEIEAILTKTEQACNKFSFATPEEIK